VNRPKIVVLDGRTLNPGDLSWAEFEALGPLTVHERTPPGEVVARAGGAAILLTNKTPLGADTLARLPQLRYIGVLATGYNVVDVAAARARGVPVTNVPEYSTLTVAQHTFALLLELTQHVGHHAASVREGRWTASPDFCYWDTPLIELAGMELGLVGYGRIGQAVARIGEAMGMRVRRVRRTDGRDAMERLLAESDVVSLHCPLTPETRQLICAATLNRMKPSAFLLNTSRGGLVNEADLADALNAGRIAGAGLDVLSVEPPPADNPLLGARNCILTPHHAWAAEKARRRLMAAAAANLRAFLAGTAVNVVNPEVK
jgi:glycerate dehydrogenase